MVYWYTKVVVWGQFDFLSLCGIEHVSETAVESLSVSRVPPDSAGAVWTIVRLVFVGQSEDSCPFSRLNKDTLCIIAGAVAEVSLCMEEQAVR